MSSFVCSCGLPYYLLKDPGLYDVHDPNDEVSTWWLDIKVFKKSGELWFINPDNNKTSAIKGMHGWFFRKKTCHHEWKKTGSDFLLVRCECEKCGEHFDDYGFTS